VRPSRLSLAVLGAAAALVAGCAGGDGGQADPQPTATPPAVTEATAAAPDVLAFTAPLVGGGELDAATLAGETAVFWFWSPF
jgi:hypothetical protein